MRKMSVILASIALVAAGAVSAQAGAKTVTTHTEVAVRSFMPSLCGTPDLVDIAGRLKLTAHVTLNDNVAVAGLHVNSQGIGGAALITGTKYVGNGTAQTSEKLQALPAHVNLPFHAQLLRQGEGGDLRVNGHVHGIVHRDGTFGQAFVRINSLECSNQI